MVAKTGFWFAPDCSRVLWARDNGSDRRCELWELFKTPTEFVWRDVSEQFRAYGFAGYLGALRVQGWTVSQQPNAHTRDLVETPHIPYPSMMLAGGAADNDGWRYMAGMVSNPSADMVGMSRAAEYRIARAAVSVSDLSDLHGCLTLPGSVPDGFSADDFTVEGDGFAVDSKPDGDMIGRLVERCDEIYKELYNGTSTLTGDEYRQALSVFDSKTYRADVLDAFDAYRQDFVSSDREVVAFIVGCRELGLLDDPEPVTCEIKEVQPVEPVVSRVRVTVATIPAGVACKDLDVFKAYGRKPRAFRDSRGRRVAYVAFDATGGVIAYRDYYQPDNVADTAISDYMAAHNLIKVA